MVDRHPAVAQALDHVRLPQRSLPGQPRRVQAAHQLEQLPAPARAGKRAVPHVVLDVEGPVGLPDQLAGGPRGAVRVAQVERRHLGHGAQLAHQRAFVALVGVLGTGEEVEPTDVHRHLAALHRQESESYGVQERGHGPSIAAPGRRVQGRGQAREPRSSLTTESTTATRSPPGSCGHRALPLVGGAPVRDVGDRGAARRRSRARRATGSSRSSRSARSSVTSRSRWSRVEDDDRVQAVAGRAPLVLLHVPRRHGRQLLAGGEPGVEVDDQAVDQRGQRAPARRAWRRRRRPGSPGCRGRGRGAGPSGSR